MITVTGRITCTTGDFFIIGVRVFQGNGQNQESASGSSNQGVCTGSPQLWEVQATSFTGAFRKGKANASATGQNFGVDFDSKSVGAVIYLS